MSAAIRVNSDCSKDNRALLQKKMFLMRTFATCLLMAFLAQQVSLSSGQGSGSKFRKQRPAPGRAQKSGGSAALHSGKFSTKYNMQCAWEARDVGEDTVKLSVKCENPEARVKGGVTAISCDYNAKPQKCKKYASSSKNFWKQVSRALNKLQEKVCKDERALVKTSVCKRAHTDSHFRLDISSSVSSTQSGDLHTPPPPPPPQPTSASTSASTACTKRADHSQKAEDSSTVVSP
ncbi:hypothetical protein PAMP_021256 [Pampus punctatissimus]